MVIINYAVSWHTYNFADIFEPRPPGVFLLGKYLLAHWTLRTK